MGQDKAQANLRTFMLTQDFNPQHWDWDQNELKALSSAEDTAKVIANRFAAAGFPLQEAYAIEHSRDEKEIWDEYKNKYIRDFSGPHLHFVAKLGEANSLPLETIASIAGVDPAYIEKPRAGRYAYDNMLAYLIHIKYPSKYQYSPEAVVTLAGKSYMEYYREKHKSWMKGRAKRIAMENDIKLEEILMMISEGKLSKKELLIDPQYKYVYIANKPKIDRHYKNTLKYIDEQALAKKGKFDEDIDMLRGTKEVNPFLTNNY